MGGESDEVVFFFGDALLAGVESGETALEIILADGLGDWDEDED